MVGGAEDFFYGESVFVMQEMNPESKRFQRILGNPMAYVPFKATEPWLEEYIGTNLHAVLRDVGFQETKCASSTPGHSTLVAKKPNLQN